MNVTDTVDKKEDRLVQIISAHNSALVAFSGGVDSTYLLYKTVQVLGNRVMAVTAHSQLHPANEADTAEKLARGLGVRHLVATLDLLALPDVVNNSPDRCYSCKKHIFTRMKDIAAERGFEAVFEGTNADDTTEDRPGLFALKELGVQSPLKAAGLTKDEIRLLSKDAGLATSLKPSAACLATRFPRGEQITSGGLSKVADAEHFLRKLGLKGDLRVRVHGGNLARIEVSDKEKESVYCLEEEITIGLIELGFSYVTLDLEGFRSGSMN
jgi:pyridinium-3,5-biscarboxylic acid mononucleotide sulfurtransferase